MTMRRLTREEIRAAMAEGHQAGYELRPTRPMNRYLRAALDAHHAGDLRERRSAGLLARIWYVFYREGRNARLAELEVQFAVPYAWADPRDPETTYGAVVVHSRITVDGTVHECDWNGE